MGNCNGGKCGGGDASCKCGSKGCDGGCDGTDLRLAAWRRREPGCGPQRCEAEVGWRPDCKDIADRLVAMNVAKLVKTRKGPALVFAGGLVAMVADLCNDNPFGLPFNCERRASEFSPSDGDSIIETYAFENYVAAGAVEVNSVPGLVNWYWVRLGGLGVSHKFCLTSIGIQAVAAGGPDPVIILPVGIGIGGETIACGDGTTGSVGSYVRVWEKPSRANPSAISVTEYRCACKDLCAWTPARGGEAFYFATPVDIDLTTVEVSLEITRCSWLTDNPKGCCVENVAGRLASIAAGYTGELRTSPGAAPFLPPVG